MKKLSLYSILFACLIGRVFNAAAQQQLRLQFIDSSNHTPVSKVSILDREGQELTSSDKDGYVTIKAPSTYFIALRKGYKPDTIRNQSSAIVYVKPLSVTLDDVVVNSKKVRRVLHSAMEYVVDYDFAGDNILVASYSGDNGRNAKLFLLSDAGDTLALTKFQDQPIALFRSCTGHHYCISKDKMYPLDVDETGIRIGYPWDIEMLPLLSQCEQNIGTTFYYHFVDKEAFNSVYSYKKAEDFESVPFYTIGQPADAKGNWEEEQEILAMLQFGNFKQAMKLNGMRRLRNDISYRSLGLPIFRTSDSLVIFDFNKMLINYFEPDGKALPETGIAFDPGKTFRISIIQDLATSRFYIYDPVSQSLEEVNIQSGEKENAPIALRKPFAEKVKVHKGNIYYLWQDGGNSATRQLFVQSPF